MNRIKQTAAIFILISLLSASVYAQDAKVPSVREIIEKRQKLRKQTESIIAKIEEVTKSNYPKMQWAGTRYAKLEQSYDGFRTKSTQLIWGNVCRIYPDVKEKDAQYGSYLWDDKNRYTYDSPGLLKPGYLMLMRRGRHASAGMPGTYIGQILGYHWFDGAHRNVERMLLERSTRSRVRKKMQSIRGSECYVIEATIRNMGKYTLWIDPAHDYHITRIQVKRKEGDRLGLPLKAKDFSNEVFDVLEYQKITGIWYPKKCRFRKVKRVAGNPLTEDRVITFKEVCFNPDHDKLGSFKTDDIVDGTVTRPLDFSNEDFVWINGKVVDQKGNGLALKKNDDKTNEQKKSTKPSKGTSGASGGMMRRGRRGAGR